MSALRAVKPGEKRARPKSLAQAIESGDYREILEAQRREIAKSLPEERGPAKAALHRQLSLISKELQTIAAADLRGEKSVVADTDDAEFDGTGC